LRGGHVGILYCQNTSIKKGASIREEILLLKNRKVLLLENIKNYYNGRACATGASTSESPLSEALELETALRKNLDIFYFKNLKNYKI
jgi:hypothetical protein